MRTALFEGSLTITHNLCLAAVIRKLMNTHVNPSFTIRERCSMWAGIYLPDYMMYMSCMVTIITCAFSEDTGSLGVQSVHFE